MNRENACLTADDHLRVPSQSGESFHEFRATQRGIHYRRTRHDGVPVKGLVGTWKSLSVENLLKHLVSCEWQPAAAAWFKRHGVTIDGLRRDLATQRMKRIHSKATRLGR